MFVSWQGQETTQQVAGIGIRAPRILGSFCIEVLEVRTAECSTSSVQNRYQLRDSAMSRLWSVGVSTRFPYQGFWWWDVVLLRLRLCVLVKPCIRELQQMLRDTQFEMPLFLLLYRSSEVSPGAKITGLVVTRFYPLIGLAPPWGVRCSEHPEFGTTALQIWLSHQEIGITWFSWLRNIFASIVPSWQRAR